MLTRLLPLILPFAFAAGTVHAQSSLGVQGLSAELSYGTADDGRSTVSGTGAVDVMVTDVHGLQLDFGLIDTEVVTFGQLGAHIYMRPRETQKYGLFAVLSDVDEFSVQYVNAGVEARLGLSDQTAGEFRFGIGGTTGMGGMAGDQWDYVFAGVGVLHDFSDTITASARFDLTEFDEGPFSAIGLDSQFRIAYSARGSNVEFFADLHNAALLGQDAAPAITTFGLGVTVNLGRSGDSVMDRPFQNAAPLDQLVTRGIVALY